LGNLLFLARAIEFEYQANFDVKRLIIREKPFNCIGAKARTLVRNSGWKKHQAGARAFFFDKMKAIGLKVFEK
jgi:hypothetical protein